MDVYYTGMLNPFSNFSNYLKGHILYLCSDMLPTQVSDMDRPLRNEIAEQDSLIQKYSTYK